MFHKSFAGACLLVAALSLHAADTAAPNVRIVEEIVAKVNNDIITRGELEQQRLALEADVKRETPNLRGDALNQEISRRQADALRDQIDQALLVQRGKDLNLKVESEITRRIAQIQADSKIADPEKFHTFIREQTGMTFEDFKQQLTNQMLTQRVIGQEVTSRINMADADLKDYYEKHKSEFVREETVFLSEILVKVPEGADANTLAAADKKAKDIVARARKGEKWPELARSYSDSETATQGGQLPPYKRGQLNKKIEDLVFTKDRGYVAEPFRTPNGFLILKVEERYAAGQAPYEEVKNEIMEKLYTPKIQPQVRQYLTKLREEAFIQIRGGYVDSGAAPGKDTSWQDPATLKPETISKSEVKRRKKYLGLIPHGTGTSSSKPGKAALY